MAKSKATPEKEVKETVKGVSEEMVAELTNADVPPPKPAAKSQASTKAPSKPAAKQSNAQPPKPKPQPKPQPQSKASKVEAFVSRTDVDHKLHEALTAGRTSPLVGLVIALLFWSGCGFFAAYEWFLNEESAGLPSMHYLVAGSIFVFVVGLLIIMAGFMARGSTRAARANALVLQAGVSLLRPSQNVTSEIKTFSEEIATGTTNVNTAAVTALESMKVLSANIEVERVKLETVATNAAKDARSLVEKIESERAKMEQLSQDINNQTQTIVNAIPKQSEVMKDAISQAQAEMSQVDDALERRIQMMEKVGETLGGKLVELEELTKDSTSRVEQVVAMATELETQLSTVQKDIKEAGEYSKSAAEVAGLTGAALKNAVATAIDSAKVASVDIYARTRTASEEMARALADLRMESENTLAALRSTGVAAKSETDVAEKRLMSVAHVIERATNVVISGLEEATRAESTPIQPASDPSGVIAKNTTVQESEPVEEPAPEATKTEASADPSSDGENSEASEDVEASTTKDITDIVAEGASGNQSDTGDEQTIDREQLANQYIEKLQDSGIQLSEIIAPKHKKKISGAARKGDKERRQATKSVAGRDIDRIVKRFKSDADLRKMAEDFVAAEKEDALAALATTARSANNASPRLTAFLLTDMALTK